MKGANSPSQPSNYGTQGVPLSSNTPGSRGSSFMWTGNDGLLYLFGGQGSPSDKMLNDLWQCNPTTTQWTWISGSNDGNQPGVYNTKGSEASTSYPGGRRNGTTWVTSDGKRYLFGGSGFDFSTNPFGYLNDLWRFNPATNQWAWMNGSNGASQVGTYGTQNVPSGANTPGGREGCASWTGDDGQLYLFGGFGLGKTSSTGHLNDLWRYNPATNQWTWIGGSDGIGQAGTFGTPNVPASTNFPGARIEPRSWTGTDGYLYLFGGRRFLDDSALNDMWRFNIATQQWTWLKGSSDVNQNGIYGTQCIPAGTNTPGSRRAPAGWTSSKGQLFLFGGAGLPKTGTTKGVLDDLWMFTPSTNNWTWIKGNDQINQLGSYGTQGVSSDSNNPRSRTFTPGIWTTTETTDGALYLFGGNSSGGDLNDLWRGTVMPCSLVLSDVKYMGGYNSYQVSGAVYTTGASFVVQAMVDGVLVSNMTISDNRFSFNHSFSAPFDTVQITAYEAAFLDCSDSRTLIIPASDICQIALSDVKYTSGVNSYVVSGSVLNSRGDFRVKVQVDNESPSDATIVGNQFFFNHGFSAPSDSVQITAYEQLYSDCMIQAPLIIIGADTLLPFFPPVINTAFLTFVPYVLIGFIMLYAGVIVLWLLMLMGDNEA